MARSRATEEYWRRLPLNKIEGKIAAKDNMSLPGEAIRKRARQRPDAGDRHDAQRDTGEKNRKTGQTAAKLPSGDAQRERQAK
jgi:hypothetical protein